MPPVIAEGSVVNLTLVEGVDPVPYEIALHAADGDGDPLCWLSGSGSHGAAVTFDRTGTSNLVSYTPAPGYTGADAVDVHVYDGMGGIDLITINLYIEPAEPILTVVDGYGVADPAEGTHTNTRGDSVTCSVSNTATVGTTRYVSIGWTLAGQTDTTGWRTYGSTTVVDLVHIRDTTLTWTWETNYWLAVSASDGGSVTPADGWYASGAGTALTAVASEYWQFDHWSGDTNGCGIAGNVITAAMTQARSVTANFAANLATNAMPEWWLASHGWTSGFDAAALADTDNDGMPAWAEFHADTIPTNAESVLAIIGLSLGAGGVDIVWKGGTSARQFVEMKSDLGSTGEQWTAVYTNEPVTPVTNALPLPGPAPDGGFYRIRVGGE